MGDERDRIPAEEPEQPEQPELKPEDLVPHLKGLAKILRKGEKKAP